MRPIRLPQTAGQWIRGFVTPKGLISNDKEKIHQKSFLISKKSLYIFIPMSQHIRFQGTTQ